MSTSATAIGQSAVTAIFSNVCLASREEAVGEFVSRRPAIGCCSLVGSHVCHSYGCVNGVQPCLCHCCDQLQMFVVLAPAIPTRLPPHICDRVQWASLLLISCCLAAGILLSGQFPHFWPNRRPLLVWRSLNVVGTVVFGGILWLQFHLRIW